MSERAQRVKKKIEAGGNYFTRPKTDVKFIHSGSTLLDLALGGGWAENRIANIVGDASSGKTLLAIEACTNFAMKYPKGKIRYCETEAAFSEDYAAALGMPIDRIDLETPIITVEELFQDISKYTKTDNKYPKLYIVDSLDALSDSAELEKDFNEGSYGTAKARQMSKLFRMTTKDVESSDTTVLIISQTRDNIGAMFGDKIAVSGGKALKFYSSQRLFIYHLGQIDRTIHGIKRVTGIKVRGNVRKNKVGLPFREAQFNIDFGYGINDTESCLNWLKTTKAPVSFGDPSTYLKQLAKMNDKEYHESIDKIHKLVESQWWSIETSLLPKRAKYDRRESGSTSQD
jgi:recombination protein RecA